MTKYVDYSGELTRENYYQLHHDLRANRTAEPHDVVVRLRGRTAGRDTAFIRGYKNFSGVSCFTMTYVRNYLHHCRVVYQCSDTRAEKNETLNDARSWVERYGY